MLKPCLIISLGLLLPACAHVTWTQGVPDLHQVEPGLLRGGEPTAEGWHYLTAQRGVCADLQLDFDRERVAPPPAGVRVLDFAMPPSNAWDWWRGPSAAMLAAAVSTIGEELAAGCPVYVHCLHGHDRTGLVVAAWRRRRGWSKKDAWTEALRLGFHRVLIGLVEAWDKVP